MAKKRKHRQRAARVAHGRFLLGASLLDSCIDQLCLEELPLDCFLLVVPRNGEAGAWIVPRADLIKTRMIPLAREVAALDCIRDRAGLTAADTLVGVAVDDDGVLAAVQVARRPGARLDALRRPAHRGRS